MPTSAGARFRMPLAVVAAGLVAAALGGCFFDGTAAEVEAACANLCDCNSPSAFPAEQRECVATCEREVELDGVGGACLGCVASLTCDEIAQGGGACSAACGGGVDDGGDGDDDGDGGGDDPGVPPPER